MWSARRRSPPQRAASAAIAPGDPRRGHAQRRWSCRRRASRLLDLADLLEGLGIEEHFRALVLLVEPIDLVAAVLGFHLPDLLPAVGKELVLQLGLLLPFGLRDVALEIAVRERACRCSECEHAGAESADGGV